MLLIDLICNGIEFQYFIPRIEKDFLINSVLGMHCEILLFVCKIDCYLYLKGLTCKESSHLLVYKPSNSEVDLYTASFNPLPHNAAF